MNRSLTSTVSSGLADPCFHAPQALLNYPWATLGSLWGYIKGSPIMRSYRSFLCWQERCISLECPFKPIWSKEDSSDQHIWINWINILCKPNVLQFVIIRPFWASLGVACQPEAAGRRCRYWKLVDHWSHWRPSRRASTPWSPWTTRQCACPLGTGQPRRTWSPRGSQRWSHAQLWKSHDLQRLRNANTQS